MPKELNNILGTVVVAPNRVKNRITNKYCLDTGDVGVVIKTMGSLAVVLYDDMKLFAMVNKKELVQIGEY